jgi:hypothetical protein
MIGQFHSSRSGDYSSQCEILARQFFSGEQVRVGQISRHVPHATYFYAFHDYQGLVHRYVLVKLERERGRLSYIHRLMNSFYEATQELGVANDVTTFTLSEFSRTLQPGTNAGTDHAWGSHQLIQGGAVKGNTVYGTFPTLVLAGPADAGNNGRWIPTTALDQYAATLASWFGVSNANLPTIFPNLSNFSTNNLGFMG